MNIHDTQDKVLLVVASCKTYQQFEGAVAYAGRWIDHLISLECKSEPITQDFLVECMLEVSNHLKAKKDKLTPPLP